LRFSLPIWWILRSPAPKKLVRGRGRAIGLIYLLLVVLLITFFFVVGPKIARQGQRLSESLPKLLETVSSGQIAEQIGKEQGWSVHTRVQLSTLLASHRNDLLGMAQRIGLRMADVAKEAWLLIVVPILAGFFLKDGALLAKCCSRWCTPVPSGNSWRGCWAISTRCWPNSSVPS
jgi:predicted PurR-regulated permease PerM